MQERERTGLPPHIYPPEEWRLVEKAFAPRYVAQMETVFATSNGYLGIRGAFEERAPVFQPGTFVNAFHETWPGHHLQVAIAQSVDGLHPVTNIIWFSGPGEGWARYSEALAEEMGLYATTTGPILRRAWPARGMVVDPGLHLFGWTREQAVSFMAEAGRFSERRADEIVDRIAILPGQLTAYDSGGLEVLALRRQAETRLGDDFDIRAFHDALLGGGALPLDILEQRMDAWLATQRPSTGE